MASSEHFTGSIIETRVHDRALDVAEIAELATSRQRTASLKPVGLGDELIWACPTFDGPKLMTSTGDRDGSYMLNDYGQHGQDPSNAKPIVVDNLGTWNWVEQGINQGLYAMEIINNSDQSLKYPSFFATAPGGEVDPADAWTFSIWTRGIGGYKSSSTSGLMCFNTTDSYRYFGLFSSGTSGNSGFKLNRHQNQSANWYMTGGFPSDRWWHLVGRMRSIADGGHSELNVNEWDLDGNLIDSHYVSSDQTTAATAFTGAEPYHLGVGGWGNSDWGNQWDDARMYHRYITDDEMALLQLTPAWTRDYVPPEPPAPEGNLSPFVNQRFHNQRFNTRNQR